MLDLKQFFHASTQSYVLKEKDIIDTIFCLLNLPYIYFQLELINNFYCYILFFSDSSKVEVFPNG